MWKFIAIVMLVPMPSFSLAPEPGLQKKSWKSNHFVVNTILLSQETTKEQKQDFLDMTIWNAKGTVHDSGVVQIDYGSGLSSWSCVGTNAETKILAAGASKIRARITENVNGTIITHAQTRQFWPRVSEFVKKMRFRKYVTTNPLDRSNICGYDNLIIDEILRGGQSRINKLMREHKYKVFSNNGTVYLLLDDVIDNGVSILRFDGVTESTERHQRGPLRAVKMFNSGPSMFNIEQPKTGGWLDYGDAKRDFEIASNLMSDEPLALGRYSFTNNGFVVFGVKYDDIRFMLSSSGLFYENKINGHVEQMKDTKDTFKEMGKQIRSFHSMGIIHGDLRMSNIGLNDPEMDGSFSFRGLCKSFQLPTSASPQERAGWAFSDLSHILELFSELEQNGVDGGQFTSKFLDGYFNGYVPLHVVTECSSPLFATKIKWLSSGGVSIPDVFPMTYEFLLMTELNEWELNLEETKDERAFTVEMQKRDREKKADDDDDTDIDGGSMSDDDSSSYLLKVIKRKLDAIRNINRNS